MYQSYVVGHIYLLVCSTYLELQLVKVGWLWIDHVSSSLLVFPSSRTLHWVVVALEEFKTKSTGPLKSKLSAAKPLHPCSLCISAEQKRKPRVFGEDTTKDHEHKVMINHACSAALQCEFACTSTLEGPFYFFTVCLIAKWPSSRYGERQETWICQCIIYFSSHLTLCPLINGLEPINRSEWLGYPPASNT